MITIQEAQVKKLADEGHSIREIAKILKISHHSVKALLISIKRKQKNK